MYLDPLFYLFHVMLIMYLFFNKKMLYSRSMAMHEIGLKKNIWHNVRKDKEFGMIHRNTTKVEISRLKDSIRWMIQSDWHF